jgi:hypothetical protein
MAVTAPSCPAGYRLLQKPIVPEVLRQAIAAAIRPPAALHGAS